MKGKEFRTQNKTQSIVFVLFSVITTLLVFWFLFQNISLEQLKAAILGIHTPWLMIFVLLSISMSILRTWRYVLLIKIGGHLPPKIVLFLITLVRNLFSDLLPARLGTLVYIYLVKTRLGLPMSVASTSFAISFIFDIISLSILLMVALFFLDVESLNIMVLVSASVALLVASSVLLYFLSPLITIFETFLKSRYFPLQGLKGSFLTFLSDLREDLKPVYKSSALLKLFTLSVGIRCCKYLSLYFLLLAIVVPLGFYVQDFPTSKVFIGLCSAELAASLPISGIAGFGAYEGVWTFVFQLLGVSATTAALTGVSHHLITQLFGYSIGALALLVLLILKKRSDRTVVGSVRSSSNLNFFGTLILFLICIAFITSFLFNFTVQTGDTIGQKTPESLTTSNSKPHKKISVVKGKLVAQKDTGLFVTVLNGPTIKEELVDHKGTKPRWAPGGNMFAYIRDNSIILYDLKRKEKSTIFVGGKSLASLCFHPNSLSLFFADNRELKEITLQNKKVTSVYIAPSKIFELDLGNNGELFALTLKKMYGYGVYLFDRKKTTLRMAAKGCSPNIDPTGKIITVNSNDHKRLSLLDSHMLSSRGLIHAPKGFKFDNQIWTNDPQWIVSVTEGQDRNVYLHSVITGTTHILTQDGNYTRADVFVKHVISNK